MDTDTDTDEMTPESRKVIDAWIARGRRRTVEQDAMGWWVARDHGVLVLRRRFPRGLAERLEGTR